MKQAIPLQCCPSTVETWDIDALEFARNQCLREGSINLVEFSRLSDVFLESSGALQLRLQGVLDKEGASWLMLSITGVLVLRCQRCLGRLQFPVQVESRLHLVTDANDWPDGELESDEFDVISAATPVSVLQLVEDEVILALPASPMHEDCELPRSANGKSELLPFAALAALKKH